ncbi:GNAT family N-acetyltransferase [Oceanobacillus sp. 1P07AA]|uniref:GNAT family N-acetyltransferase n=1 Tax=Oceanobacillus sp. 1P07AA TaxID=3132293 RepID=UPI0039A431E2
MIGFAYGYLSLKGQYYHNLIANHLNQQEYQDWLSNCYEVGEIIVDSPYRKSGYGRDLLDRLLKDATTNTAILTTQQDNMTAIQFYKNQHWEWIKQQFYPNEEGKAFAIFGKRLKRH